MNNIASPIIWTEKGKAFHHTALIPVQGDMMWPTMYSGDFVLVDTTVNRIGGEGLYCFDYDAEPLIQRCQIVVGTGEITISSDNKAYDQYTVTRTVADAMKVIGKVKWICRKH